MRLSKPLFWIACAALAETAWANDDQIIVTATRQEQPALDYGGSIAVINQAKLETVSAVHPAELFNTIAGVNIHRGSGQEHLTATRSPVLTGGAGAGSFLYLQDGVPLRAAGFANVNGLFEAGTEFAGRAEVVKGPGSVLYGSNAVHGLINIISAPPGGDNKVRIMGSEAGLISVSGSGGGEKTRIGVSVVHDPGFRAASGFDQQKVLVHNKASYRQWDLTWISSFQNLNQETAGFIAGPEAYKDDGLRFSNPNDEAFRDARSFRSQLSLEQELRDGRRVSVTPYVRWTDLEFLRHFVPGQALEENGHKSFGLLSALYGPDYIVGVDAEYTRGFFKEFQETPTVFSFIQGAHYDYAVNAAVVAAYGQKTLRLGSKTKLTAGLRGEYTHYKYNNKIDSGVFGRFQRVDDRSDDFFTLTPKLSVTHRLNQDISVYGRLARGSRAPQTSDLYSVQINQLPGDANVETLDSTELGLKGQVAGFNIDLAAFVMSKNNFFFRNANGFNVTDGKTHHKGVEVSFDGSLTDWLSISGSATVAEHTYAFTELVASASSSILDGDDVDSAPHTLAHFTITVRPIDRVRVETEWRHVGSYMLDPGNTASYPGHDIFVFRSNFDISDAMSVFGRVDNLFDAKYADRADFAFGNERYFPGRPRTLFFGLTSRF